MPAQGQREINSTPIKCAANFLERWCEMGNGTGSAGAGLTFGLLARLMARSRGACGRDTIFGIPVLRPGDIPSVPMKWVCVDRNGVPTGLEFRC